MLMIRLRRMGTRNKPFYRMVVSDSKRVPTATAIDEVGFYNPRVDPVEIRVDRERVDHWVSQGARMSPTVARLVRQSATAAAATAAPVAPVTEPEPVAAVEAEPVVETAAEAAPEEAVEETASAEAPAEADEEAKAESE